MDLTAQDTIVALATPRQGAARGVLRLSGPKVLDCLSKIFEPSDPKHALTTIRSPQAISGSLQLPSLHRCLPGWLYLWPTRASYTRQPSAEFHTTGSLPLLDAALEQFCRSGARLAAPGEFTMRAFLAGRIDLTQAEAVLGVIDAANQDQLSKALSQLAGGLADPLTKLRNQMLDLLADLEAGLDFVEEDIQFVDAHEASRRVADAREVIAGVLDAIGRRTDAQRPPRAVLYGRPNAGKSTLWNALTENGKALVSDIKGTTRDYLVADVLLDGITVQIVDTAGIGGFDSIQLADPHAAAIDRRAQQQTKLRLDEADVLILCLDGSVPLEDWEKQAMGQLGEGPIVVWNKADLPWPDERPIGDGLIVSARTGQGLDELRRTIAGRILERQNTESPVVGASVARCAESLEQTARLLAEAQPLAEQGGHDELVAGLLRAALDQLGCVLGCVYTEDLLDRIFSRFCIGK